MVNSLLKVDFSHPTGHYTWKNCRPPLRKSWVRPWLAIGFGTGGATGAMPPHFLAKIILKIFPSFLKYNFATENEPPGRGEHKSALKCIVDGLVFAGDEMKVSLAPSLLVTFLRPCLPHNKVTCDRVNVRQFDCTCETMWTVDCACGC